MSSHRRFVCRGSTRLIGSALACGALLACHSAVEPDDGRACEQTHEFGNTGCLEITGRVVSLSEHPLAGISVGPRYLPGRAVFNTVYATTDAAGDFTFRIWRMAGLPPIEGPDTLSLWVHGADLRTAGVNIPARVRDSILVQAMVSPVGTIPVPTTVRLTLPTP